MHRSTSSNHVATGRFPHTGASWPSTSRARRGAPAPVKEELHDEVYRLVVEALRVRQEWALRRGPGRGLPSARRAPVQG